MKDVGGTQSLYTAQEENGIEEGKSMTKETFLDLVLQLMVSCY